jgi:hypothetical protein
MRKPYLLPIVILSLALGSGCAVRVSQTREKPTALSYSAYEGSIDRGVGRLRRLAVLQPQYIFIHDGKRIEREEAAASGLMLNSSLNLLKDWKGYELELYCAPPGASLDALYGWAEEATFETAPPSETKELISALGRQCAADGVLVLRGYQKPPSTWVVALTILSASLTWPLLLIESDGQLKADIIEVQSGRLVWRSRQGMTDPSKPLKGIDVESFLWPLESAVPAVLITE